MTRAVTPIRFIQTVIHAIRDADGVRRLFLRDPEGWELPPTSPGAHIDLYLHHGLTRAYSLCGDPDLNNEYCVAVKKHDAGRGGSSYVHEALHEGDGLRVSLPRNSFPLLPAGQFHVFIAGGIGVTPFIPMMRRLDRMGAPYHLHLFFREVPPLREVLTDLGRSGTLVLHDRVHDRQTTVQSLIGDPHQDTHAFFCGPLAMLDDFDVATRAWCPENVHREFFTPPPTTAADNAYSLILQKSGRTIDVPTTLTALQALQQAGVAVPSSCEGGICRACMVKVLEGEPDHRDLCLNSDERRQYFTPCVSHSRGPRLTVDL